MSKSCDCGCQHGVAAATAEVAGTAFAPDETVETVVSRSPSARLILRGLGIDTCCGSGLTLAQAAASAGIPVDGLLERLSRGPAAT